VLPDSQMIEPTSKARTLVWLRAKLSLFRIPELAVFPAAADAAERDGIVSRIQSQFAGRMIVVRSSAADEDGKQSALAGAYDSVLDVRADDRAAVEAAIGRVVASYGRNGKRAGSDEILVQEMVSAVSMSGVLFTHDLNTGAPYYVINYDDESGLTNTVTSGEGQYANRTLYIHRGAAQAVRSERFQVLLEAVGELEAAMGSRFLDVEFALGEDLTPYLFQARAITTQPNWNRAVAQRIDAELHGIQSFMSRRLRRAPGVHGRTTVLGQMPDWNPAEMIGRAPRALAMSLYSALITDRAWRDARERMNYAVPADEALMVSLAGQPFIDTRLSFNSYLPAGLPETIAEKLVNRWVERLAKHPELHDKIEFDVAITTFSFDLDDKLDRLVGDALTPAERGVFREALRQLTLPLLRGEGEGSIAAALARVKRLAGQALPDAEEGLACLAPMIADCISDGTVPFAMLARHGFIARTLLLSLVARGVLGTDDVARLQAGVRTVAGDLVDAMRDLQAGRLPQADFMARYGHLRPGTYDILSSRYDQMQDVIARGGAAAAAFAHAAFAPGDAQRAAIDRLLRDERLDGVDADSLLAYCSAAIAGREYGKFVFTRSVSAMLEIIAASGERIGLSREELSHVPLQDLLDVARSGDEAAARERLRAVSEREAERHALTSAIRLPQVLFDEAGVHVVPFQVSQPNFITASKVTAEVVYLDAHHTGLDLDGRIVLIESADPGYDWIFAQRIAGLITKYGGANSHMAIRCAEFGIPAAIGCGEQRFEAFVQAGRLSIDCSVGLIIPLC